MVDRFGMIDPASGHEPFYFGKVNDVEDYAIAGEQYVRLSDYASLRAENEALRARLASIRDETLEEAAKVAERDGSSHAAPYPHDATWQRNTAQQVIAADRIAAAIHALQTKEKNNG